MTNNHQLKFSAHVEGFRRVVGDRKAAVRSVSNLSAWAKGF
jgi:hypothetical protein